MAAGGGAAGSVWDAACRRPAAGVGDPAFDGSGDVGGGGYQGDHGMLHDRRRRLCDFLGPAMASHHRLAGCARGDTGHRGGRSHSEEQDLPGLELGDVDAEHDGQAFHFCSAGCRSKFAAEPKKYLGKYLGTREPPPEAPAGAIYTCPMHPEIRQAGPGSCPICGMALEPEASAAEADLRAADGPVREQAASSSTAEARMRCVDDFIFMVELTVGIEFRG